MLIENKLVYLFIAIIIFSSATESIFTPLQAIPFLKRESPAQLHDVTSVHTRVWGVTSSNHLWRKDSLTSSWVNMNYKCIYVTVAPDGSVWCIDPNNVLWSTYELHGVWQPWTELKNHYFYQIAFGPDGRLWGVNAGSGGWALYPLYGSSVNVGGQINYVTVGPDERVWVCNRDMGLWTREGLEGSWYFTNNWMKMVAEGIYGRMWGVGTNNEILTKTIVKDWYKISGSAKYISVSKTGRVWIVAPDNSIWTAKYYDALAGSWTQIDGMFVQLFAE
jgi:hypothetical protein